MARPFEIRDLTRPQAEETAARSRDDMPAPTRVELLAQPDGLYSVIVTYPDSTANQGRSAARAGKNKRATKSRS